MIPFISTAWKKQIYEQQISGCLGEEGLRGKWEMIVN